MQKKEYNNGRGSLVVKNKSGIKRYICVLLIALQIMQPFVAACPVQAAETVSMPGDVTGDEIINSTDLSELSSHVSKIKQISDEDLLKNADVNTDGTISAADMTVLSAMLEKSQNTFSVTNVSVDCETGAAGSIFRWSVDTEGGTGAIEYSYKLLNCSDQAASAQSDTVVAEQDFAHSNSFCASVMDIGTYMLSVTCRDEEGNLCSAENQAPVTVTVPELEIGSINLCNIGSVYAGSELELSVSAYGGVLPYQYHYKLLLNNMEIDVLEDTSSVYRWTAEQSGEYLLQVTCTDSEGTTVHASSSPISVLQMIPAPSAPPSIRIENNAYSLAQAQNNAQYIPVEQLHLYWDSVEYTDSYEIILEYLNGDEWIPAASNHISGLSYAISPELIMAFTDKTLFRIRATSQGIVSSEESIFYFYTSYNAQAENVLVDEMHSIKWNISNAEETARSFSVFCAAAWSVSTNADWISLVPGEQDFLAVIEENSGAVRSGTITVTDGSSSAYVHVRQGIGNGAPELFYPSYSKDSSAPTEVPAGGMILGFDAKGSNYVGIKLYEKSAAGQLSEVYRTVSPAKETYVQVITSYRFKINTEYVVELAGYCSEEPESDAVKNCYYIRMVSQEQKILVSGSPALYMDSFTGFSVDLYSSGAWTYTTDADWLYPEAYENVSYKKDFQSVDIILEPNETKSVRTGTITFICGEASATLTVTQKSCLPRIERPLNMSQDPENPTKLPCKGYVEQSVYETGTYACFENNAWSEEQTWGSSNNVVEWTTLYPDNFFKSNVLYRFTLHSGEHTAVYYAIFSDTLATPYAVTRLGVEDYTNLQLSFSSGAEEETVKLSTSGAWTISSDSSWLSVSEVRGTTAVSKKPLTISAAGNTTGQRRTGTLTVRSENVICAKVTVTQDSRDYITIYTIDDDNDYHVYDPETSFRHLNGSKHSVKINVKASQAYTVESKTSWISCTKSKITLTANTSGARRTGTVAVSCGKHTETITLIQEPQLAMPTLVSPSISTSYTSPSVFQNSDLKLVLNSVSGAARYRISVMPADRSLLLPDSHFYSFIKEFESTGAKTYTCVIPKNVLSVNAEDCDEIIIEVFDQYGYYVFDSFYLNTTSSSAALINGSMAPVWDHATDAAVSKDFTVRSTGAWSAVSKASWIKLNRSSGVDNDVLTVTLQPNTGNARSGQVSVTVNGTETVLTVSQCAWLPEYPAITSPVFSEDPAVPSIISAATTSLHVNWDYEPQAEYYKVSLLSFKSNSVQHIEATSPKLHTGEYTFENIILEPGQRYCLKLSRDSHWGYTGKMYYFTPGDSNAFVLVNDSSGLELDLEGSEDFDAVTVTSSGVWSAAAGNDWILVDNERITQEDLDADGYLPGDFRVFSGVSGQDLYISVLPNTTNTYRYGTVTLRCGSAESKISIVQEPYYLTAELRYPQLATLRKESTSLPYGSVNLRWSEAIGGTGTYSVTLYERDEELEYRYYEIFEKDGISSTSYTLPTSLLTEGQYYKIWIGTEINGTDETAGRWYYFRMGYKNELVVRASADWSTVGSAGYVTINASATGGAGNYLYSYELLRSNSQVSITELDDRDYHTFNITETGSYQVRVYARDGTDTVTNVLTSAYTVGTADLSRVVLSRSEWEVTASGGSTSVTIDADRGWTISFKPDWITCSSMEGANKTTVTLTASANTSGERTGNVVFGGSGKSAGLVIRQEGAALAEPTVTSPAAGASVPLQDLMAVWNPVSGAGYYIFRLRDLTTDTLLMYESGLETTTATIPAGYLVHGHQYRIAVGAAHSDDTPISGSVSWAEREFSVAAASNEIAAVSGRVLDSQGDPLQDAVILASEVDRYETYTTVARTETDADGNWSISGLKKGTTFAFEVSLSGYSFVSDTITAKLTDSEYNSFDFQAENYHAQDVVGPHELDFDSEGGSETLFIELSGSWNANTDDTWIHLSSDSGTGAAEVTVTADEYFGDDPRSGTISVTDQKGKTYIVEVFQEDAVTSFNVVFRANATKTVVDIFDKEKGEYNGAPLLAGHPYSYGNDSVDTLEINQPLTIPEGATIYITGNVIINSTVTFAADTVKKDQGNHNQEKKVPIYAFIQCSGDLTVASKGVIDMSAGGKIRVGKNFIFKPKEKHDTELSKGIIEVGGNLEIKKNFYANGDHQFHLFHSTGQHKINMWNKWVHKDQHFNHLILDTEGVDSLCIEEVFTCSTLEIDNWNFLQNALYKESDSEDQKKRTNPFIAIPRYDYTTYYQLTPAQRERIISNLNIALMRIYADFGKVTKEEDRFWIFCSTSQTGHFSYIDEKNNVCNYQVTLKSTGSDDKFTNSFGSITYTEVINGSEFNMEFTVASSPENIALAVENFKKDVLKYAAKNLDNIMKDYMSLYNALMKDLLAEVFSITVEQLENIISDVKKIKELIETLTKEKDDLQKYYEIIDRINVTS